MFGLFKKKTEVDRLQAKYEALMTESHRLSTVNRSQSDAKFTEAQAVAAALDELKKKVQ